MGNAGSPTEVAEFGRRLKMMRIERNLTAEEVAAKACVHATTISRIENGHERPKLPTLMRIVINRLGADLADL